MSLLAEVLQKIANTRGGLIRNLVKIFDELITFENIDLIEQLIEIHSECNIEKDKIIQLRKLSHVIRTNKCFDGTFQGQTASYNIVYNRKLKFKSLESEMDTKVVNDLFNKLVHKTSFLKEFIYSMIIYFIQFLGVSQETREDMHDIIDEANNKVLFSSKGNLRSICLYLQKMMNYDKMESLREVQGLFKTVRVDQMTDIQILIAETHHKKRKKEKKDIKHEALQAARQAEEIKKQREARVGRPPELPEEECVIKSHQSKKVGLLQRSGSGTQFYFKDSGRSTLNLINSQVYLMKELNTDLCDFAKKFDKCELKGLYYSIEIINKINYWIYQNYGACERELQIDVIRVILRKARHPDLIHHLLVLDKICMKNTLDMNQFFQLFLACLENEEVLFPRKASILSKTVVKPVIEEIEEQDIEEFLEDEEDEDEFGNGRIASKTEFVMRKDDTIRNIVDEDSGKEIIGVAERETKIGGELNNIGEIEGRSTERAANHHQFSESVLLKSAGREKSKTDVGGGLEHSGVIQEELG